MNKKMNTGDRLTLILMALLVAAWGVAGMMDVSQRTEAGFAMDRQHVITHLDPGGPAERVGMQLGDQVVGIAGHPIEDTATMARLPRVEAGERRAIVVDREEKRFQYRPAYRPLEMRARWREYLTAIVGFSFLLIPLTACLTRPSAATRVLALMGLGLSLAFFDGFYILNYQIRAIAVTIAQLFILLGIGAMVNFLLLFPAQRPVLQKSWSKKLIYLPMVFMWLIYGWRILFIPPADSGLVSASHVVTGLGVTAYLAIALYLLLRNYSRTERGERRQLTLNRMLWGTVFAIIPTAVAQLAAMVSPHTPLPGQQYYFVALVLIPITWTLSAVRR